MSLHLADLPTPALLLDRGRLLTNLEAMRARMSARGGALRPHLKTAKSAKVAELATEGAPGGITVSTLAEAAYFAARGFADVTYAVGIVPAKVDEAAAVAGLSTGATPARVVKACAKELTSLNPAIMIS